MKFTLFIGSENTTGSTSLLKKLRDDGTPGLWSCIWVSPQSIGENQNVQKLGGVFKWNNIEDTCEGDNTDLATVAADGNVNDSENILDRGLVSAAEEIHHAADSLPTAGALLDVYLWPPPYEDTSDYTQLLGALRRLKDWHNAQISIMEKDPTVHTEFLAKFLSAAVFLQEEDVNIHHDVETVWRGKVSLTDKVENKGLTLSGLRLCKIHRKSTDLSYPLAIKNPKTRKHQHETTVQQHRCDLGRMFEVLDEVDLATLPSYLLTNNTFVLNMYQKHPHTQVFLSSLPEDNQAALLVRIAVYPSKSGSVTCKDINLSTEAWKDNLTMNILYSQEPEEELQDNYEFLYFIISKPSAADIHTGQFDLHLTQLVSPYEVTGEVAHTLYHQSVLPHTGGSVDRSPNETSDLTSAGAINWHMLKHILKDINCLQRQHLQHWDSTRQPLEGSQEIPTSEMSPLSDILVTYLRKLSPYLSRFIPLSTQGSTEILTQTTPELCGESCDIGWPERLVLQYKESQRRCLTRMQSTESMPLSSPLQAADNPTVLDVKDILKYFNPDGSAVSSDTSNGSPSRHRKRSGRGSSKLFTQTVPDFKHVTWPEGKNNPFHDVYYNSDRKSERMNNRLNKIRDHFVKVDTYSSFSSSVVVLPYHGKKKSAGIKPSLHPVRRSPRKRSYRDMLEEESSQTQVASHGNKRFKAPGLLESNQLERSFCLKDQTESKRRLSTPHILPSQTKQKLKHRTSTHQRTNSSGENKKQDIKNNSRRQESEAETSLNSSLNVSLNSSLNTSETSKESRSARHKRRLQEIVENVLLNSGVKRDSSIFNPCSNKLFKVTKLFVMDLPTSRNLKEEMKNIAESQVKQVIEMETKKQNITNQGRSKKNSI